MNDGGGESSGLSASLDKKWADITIALEKIRDGSAEETIPNLRNDIEQYGGTNDVTIVRGNEKKGLIHIVSKHGHKAVDRVLEAVVLGKVTKFVSAKKTLHLQKEGYEAVLSLDEHGKRKTWLLTGYGIVEGK